MSRASPSSRASRRSPLLGAALLASLAWGCQRRSPPQPDPPVEPQPADYHEAATAEAAALVADPLRGGPPLSATSAPLPPFQGVDRGAATYVGAETCAACHPAIAEAWLASRHAQSRETLVEAGRPYDPRCLQCHTTGIGHPGGYAGEKQTPALGVVGCESCHGPGSTHAAAPAPGYGALPSGPEACVACHTHDNSPDFRWDAYWPKVAHGAP